MPLICCGCRSHKHGCRSHKHGCRSHTHKQGHTSTVAGQHKHGSVVLVATCLCFQVSKQPSRFVTKEELVIGVKSIQSVPSLLESTIHTVSWGRDIHYSLMQPSSGFDTLGSDFSFALLATALSCALSFCLLLRTLVAQHTATCKWQ